MAYDIDGMAQNTVKLELPGNFYYHPRYGDGASNADHYTAQWTAITQHQSWPGGNHVAQVLRSWTKISDVWSADVAGYDLLAFGDPGTDGMDIDYAISTSYKDYPKRTGYLNNVDERNPHNPPDYDARTTPDGVPDFYIIHLSSSQDAKPEGVI